MALISKDIFQKASMSIFFQTERPNKQPDFTNELGEFWFGEDDNGQYVIRRSSLWNVVGENVWKISENEEYNWLYISEPDNSDICGKCYFEKFIDISQYIGDDCKEDLDDFFHVEYKNAFMERYEQGLIDMIPFTYVSEEVILLNPTEDIMDDYNIRTENLIQVNNLDDYNKIEVQNKYCLIALAKTGEFCFTDEDAGFLDRL